MGIQQNKPAIFDWLVFSISLLLGLIFPSLADLAASSSFSVWMFLCLIMYVTGILLKRPAVYYRLEASGSRQREIPYLLFLIIGHWVMMLFVVMFAEQGFRKIAGLPMAGKTDNVSGIAVFLSIVAAAFVTWLVFKGVGKKKEFKQRNLFYRELVADIVLVSAVAMLSFVFWENTLLEAMVHMPTNSVGKIAGLFVFLSLTYLLFYLPLRYLYLIEERQGSQTWKRLLLIFLLILIRGLVEALLF